MRIDSYLATAAAAEKAEPELSRLRRTTQQVEAIFLKDLLGEMRKAAPTEDEGDSLGKDIYQDMFDTAFSQGAAQSGSLGIGKILYDRLAPIVAAQIKAQQ